MNLNISILLFFFFLCWVPGCTTPKKKTPPEPTLAPKAPPPECALSQHLDLPIALNPQNNQDPVFITNVLSRCVGDQKIEAVALLTYLPCQGRKLPLQKAGHSFAPKWVELPLDAECARPNITPQMVKKRLEAFTFDRVFDLQRVEVNPIMVQFWSVMTTRRQSGFGQLIKIFTVGSDLALWKELNQEPEPTSDGATPSKRTLDTFLFGREQSWISNKALYEFSGKLEFFEGKQFEFRIADAKSLSSQERLARQKQLCTTKVCERIFAD